MKDQKKDELVRVYLAKLTKHSPVEVYFQKPRSDVPIEVGNSPMEGGDKSKATVVVFSDFQCPFCGKGAKLTEEIHKKYGNRVKIAFKHFPLPMHKDAPLAAEASMCVYDQNKTDFWKFHDIAFAKQDKLDVDSLVEYAKASGVDEKKFKDCMNSHKNAEVVKNDLIYGEKLGVRSTPSFFVNGQLIGGALPLDQFYDVIDEELNAKQ